METGPRSLSGLMSDNMYYAFEPPWAHENENIIFRNYSLLDSFYTMKNHFQDFRRWTEGKSLGKEGVGNDFHQIKHGIFRSMEIAEVLGYVQPSLLEDTTWYHPFTQDLAGVYWRAEEGRFDEEPETLKRHLKSDIIGHIEGPVGSDTFSRIHDHFRERDRIFRFASTDRVFEEDLREAGDLYSVGYYSTALFVLGRAVERALLRLGDARKIKTTASGGRERSWRETKFSKKAKALRDIEHPKGEGKIISLHQYHKIQSLVRYRNSVAHYDDSEVSRDEARRETEAALDIVQSLSERAEDLRNLEKEIDPIRGQTV